MIGTRGDKIVFEVSDDYALTFHDMTRDVSGRWASHEAVGAKPKKEFLGPGDQKINLTITLSAGLGVKPRAVIEAIEEMVETGAVEYFILGTRPVGKNPFCLASSSETWDTIYSHGELAKASMAITLEEYT